MAGDAKTGRYGPLRMTATGQHLDAARLGHGEQINGGDDRKEEKSDLKKGRDGK